MFDLSSSRKTTTAIGESLLRGWEEMLGTNQGKSDCEPDCGRCVADIDGDRPNNDHTSDEALGKLETWTRKMVLN